MAAGHTVVHFPTDKARALLVYLALEPDRPHSRQALTGLLWPDQPQERAFANLRQTLRRLRQSLDEVQPNSADNLLMATRQTLELRADALSVDVCAIEDLMAACESHAHESLTTCEACLARLAQVVALYRGDLLPRFSLPDAPPFEEWLVICREMAQQQALTALHVLAEAHVQQGQYDQALAYATRQLTLDPYRESACRQAMRALASMGQRAAALAQYGRCQSVLRGELGVEPDAQTTEIAEQIRIRRFRPQAKAVGARGRPGQPGPAMPLPLPAYVSPFVGREQTLTEMLALMAQPGTRLLTVVGAGGMGKTRLAVEVARARQEAFPDGITFVPLASVATPAAIATVIATALGLTWRGDDPNLAIRQALQRRRTLLILDNFEHVLEGSGLVVELLEAAPDIQVIVTSRERLNVRGEHVYRVSGMQYDLSLGLAEAAALPAVRLFVQSVRRVRLAFELNDTNVAQVLHICALVQGMPLGLELAAAWVETLNIDEIAQEIEASADFLAYDWRDAPERQRSLRAVFDWSWGLLKAEEQRALARLAVFSGEFGRDAAHEVAGVSRQALTRLLHKSLLQAGSGAGSERHYEMHNLLRQFAAERLAALEPDGATHDRHAHYYLRLLADQEAPMRSTQPLQAAAVVRQNAIDMREAWFHALHRGEWALLAKTLHSLVLFYRLDGWLRRGLQICEESLERLAEGGAVEADTPRRRLVALLNVARALFYGRLAAVEAATTSAQQALAEARALDDMYLAALAALYLAIAQTGAMAQHVVAATTGADATQMLSQALAWCRAYAPRTAVERLRRAATEAEIVCYQGVYLNLRGEYEAARIRCQEALEICRRVDNRYLEGTISFAYAEVLESAGRFGQARHLREQALIFARTIGGPEREGSALNNLAGVLIYLGEYAAAVENAKAARRLSEELGLTAMPILHTLSVALIHLGHYKAALDYDQRAWIEAHDRSTRSFFALGRLARGDALSALARWDEAETAYHEALALGREFEAPAAIATALAGRARVALGRGEPDAAWAWADEAWALLAVHQPAAVYEPLRTYLTCYEALAANADPRADGVIERAHAILMEQASWIDEPEWRRSFLDNVAAHRDIQQAYAARLAATEARP